MSAATPTVRCSEEKRVQVDLTIPALTTAWDEEDIVDTGSFCFGDWSFFLRLHQAYEDLIDLHLYADKSGLLPFRFTSYRVELVGKTLQRPSPAKAILRPAWSKSYKEGVPEHMSVYSWLACTTAADLLKDAEARDGTLHLTVTIVAVVHPSPQFSSCLRLPAEDVMHMWKDPAMVVLEGEGGSSVAIPKLMAVHFSEVWRAALRSDMTESRSHVIDTKDASRQALEDLRSCFIQGGFPASVCTSLDRVLDLLVLANRYAITPLVTCTTFYACAALLRQNVARVIQLADKHGLCRLLYAALRFAAFDPKMSLIQSSAEYETYSAELLRVVSAYAELHPEVRTESIWNDIPPNLQWGDMPQEFPDTTDWQSLSRPQLRRACVERCLATTGSAEEVVARLSAHCSAASAPPAKRQKTDAANAQTDAHV
eukprot:TRINITY_DN10409_c0_g1_i1.p1 TRINITY_DN10409_c0_g1~~TRINITY_DN10409_c0_g1_i1.p1  ORF type:complete len:426 (+),score=39.84 TRINITY_DN10409_c0_g1_i1:185-1462(+)